MAWWYARLLFHGDRLVDAGLHDALPPATEVVAPDAAPPPAGAEAFTSVCVSGYALYGRLRGYYALGVGHFGLDPATGRAFATEAALCHTEPVASLSPRQRSIVGAWLQEHSPEAWASSLERFQQALVTAPLAAASLATELAASPAPDPPAPDSPAQTMAEPPPAGVHAPSVGVLHAP